MADTKMSIMENIFREMIIVIGYEKALEIVTNFKTTITTDKPKAETKAETKKVDDEKKKRIPRMSPTLANQLKTELGKVGLKYSEDDKKEFDKIKKEFVSYIDDLTDDDFAGKGLADHMRDFANSKNPTPVEKKAEDVKVEKKAEDVKVVKTEEKPKKGGKKKEEPKKDEALQPPSNAANIQTLSLEDLQAIEMTATVDGREYAGIYWDADTGRWVRGPDRDDDEDVLITTFRGKSYYVGEKTGRVYEDTDDRDVFHGFIGVGQFRGMKMPEV